MKKTLAVILNYNLPEFTTKLFNQLYPYHKDLVDLIVIDNGSDEDKIPPGIPVFALPENTYFGGGLNMAVKVILENKDKYDSLLFLNNDLSIHGYNFIKELRDELFSTEVTRFGMVSPCVIGGHGDHECYWPQMHNWGKKYTRKVEWIDFQSPLIRIEVLEKIGQYPEGLWPGYGYDVYTSMICHEMGFDIGVLDRVPVIHYGEATHKLTNPSMKESDYSQLAQQNMFNYFDSIGKLAELGLYRHRAMEYKI